MDTRKKILSADELTAALAGREWVAVVGWFDPMTAIEAERVADFREYGNVLAVVLDGDHALLPAEARAVLAAALRDVDAVLIAPPEKWRAMLPKEFVTRIVEDSGDSAQRRDDFREMVRRRQQLR